MAKLEISATAVLALAGLAVIGVVVYKVAPVFGKAADLAEHVVTKTLNPASDDNFVNQGLLAIGRSITGDDTWTLGGSIYDALHEPMRPDLVQAQQTAAQVFNNPTNTAAKANYSGWDDTPGIY